MKLTACVSGTCGAVFVLINAFVPQPIFISLAITCITIFYHFIMRVVVGGVYQCKFNNQMDYTRRWFAVDKNETRLYKTIKVKRWKAYMPTYDSDTFDLNVHTYEEVVMATCQAELVHEMIVLLSFLPLIAIIFVGSAGVFIITSVLAALIDMAFVMIQRFNRPRLIEIMHRKAQESETEVHL